MWGGISFAKLPSDCTSNFVAVVFRLVSARCWACFSRLEACVCASRVRGVSSCVQHVGRVVVCAACVQCPCGVWLHVVVVCSRLFGVVRGCLGEVLTSRCYCGFLSSCNFQFLKHQSVWANQRAEFMQFSSVARFWLLHPDVERAQKTAVNKKRSR